MHLEYRCRNASVDRGLVFGLRVQRVDGVFIDSRHNASTVGDDRLGQSATEIAFPSGDQCGSQSLAGSFVICVSCCALIKILKNTKIIVEVVFMI